MEWNGSFYCDITMPFGSRLSSCHMQRVAEGIVGILRGEGIICHMYLDDLVLLSPNRDRADLDYARATQLLEELGLPQAKDKAQKPSTSARWLGVIIDTANMTIAVPPDKLAETLDQVCRIVKKRSISKKMLQSILGKLLHIAKCVRPARLYVSKLLEALRQMKGYYINVNAEMKSDLRWFLEFGESWNGVSLIPKTTPDMEIHVDACLTGIGASDGQRAYAKQVAEFADPADNITELEGLNIAVAMDTFLSESNAGSHVLIHCDNQPAVDVFSSGRGRNKVLLDSARKAWLIQARLSLDVTYVHIPGVSNIIADRLSRAHISNSCKASSDTIVRDHNLSIIDPVLDAFDSVVPTIRSRSEVPLPARQSNFKAVPGTGSRHAPESQDGSGNLHSIHEVGRAQPGVPIAQHSMRVHRVPQPTYASPGHSQELHLAREDTPDTGRARDSSTVRPKSLTGSGWPGQDKRAHTQGKATTADAGFKGYYYSPRGHTGRQGGEGSLPTDVLRGTASVGGGATFSQRVQKYVPPHKRGHILLRPQHDCEYKIRQESTKMQSAQKGRPGSFPRQELMCDSSHAAGDHGHSNRGTNRTMLHVSSRTDANASHVPEQKVERDIQRPRDSPQRLYTSWSQGNRSLSSIPGWGSRVRHPALWWMEIPGAQNLHQGEGTHWG